MSAERDGLASLQETLGHDFSDRDLLDRALTHASAGDDNYERLEFLGDRVLGLAVAHALLDAFPGESEGDLARRHAMLVSGPVLAGIAAPLNLGDVLNLSHAERAAGGGDNENILSDAVESLAGALYLDGGFDAAKRAVLGLYGDLIRSTDAPPQDPKTALQEWTQARGLGLPSYALAGRSGPDHAPVFTVSVHVDGYDPLTDQGSSRRAAEKAVAAKMLSALTGKKP